MHYSFLLGACTLLLHAAAWTPWSSTDTELYRRYDESLEGDVVIRLERRLKVKLRMSDKKSVRGSYPVGADYENVRSLGEAALEKRKIKSGQLVAGWHGEGSTSKDTLRHFDIDPDDGSKTIHVYGTGHSTQGDERLSEADRKIVEDFDKNSGNKTKTKKKSKRELAAPESHRRAFLKARQLYADAIDDMFDIDSL